MRSPRHGDDAGPASTSSHVRISPIANEAGGHIVLGGPALYLTLDEDTLGAARRVPSLDQRTHRRLHLVGALVVKFFVGHPRILSQLVFHEYWIVDCRTGACSEVKN